MNELAADFFERNIHAQEVWQAGEKLFYDRGAAESARCGTPERHTRKEYQAHVDAQIRAKLAEQDAQRAGIPEQTGEQTEPAGAKQAKK
jgi:hypothetical protein